MPLYKLSELLDAAMDRYCGQFNFQLGR